MVSDGPPRSETVSERHSEGRAQVALDPVPPPVAEVRLADMAVAMANALGTAWATYQLYPDPSGHVGFDRALGDLAESLDIKQLEVGPRTFLWDQSEVPSTHGGVERIVERLFANSIAAVRFVSPPNAKDLVALFEVIHQTPAELEDQGGAAAGLRNAGVHSIRLLERRILRDEDTKNEQLEDETDGPADVLDYKGDPEALAAFLLTTAGEDSSALASLVIDRYSRALGAIDQQGVWEHEEIVHTFVDMFFYFPPRYQAPLISELLARQHEPLFRIFLDQFASHEINELAGLLDPQAHPLLLEYARIAGKDDDRGNEIFNLLKETAPGESVNTMVDRRIAAVLAPGSVKGNASGSSALARLAHLRRDSPTNTMTGVGVVQRLLSVAESDADTNRVLRIWAGKTAAAIRHRDLESALIWLRGVSDPGSAADDPAGPASQALQRVIEMHVVVELVEALRDAPDSTAGTELLRRLAPHLTDHLIELLGREEDLGRRRELVAMVVEVSHDNPARVVAHLDDPRWYLVRNLAIVLGRCRHPDMVHHLLPLTRHPEARVRREALRTIYSLARHTDIKPFIDGLVDLDESVRTAAATILHTCKDGKLVPALEALLASQADTNVKLEIVALLGAQPTSDAHAALERQAQGGSGGRGVTRTVRNAARQILQNTK